MKKARDTEFYLFFGTADRANRLHCAFGTYDQQKIARKMRANLPAFNESAINLAREMMSVKQKLHAKWGNKIFIFPSSSRLVYKKESADKFNDLFFMATCMPFQDEWIEKRRQQALLAFILWWHHRLLVLVLCHGLKINDQWERKIQQVSYVYASGFLLRRLLVDRKLMKKAILNTKWSFDSAFVVTGDRKLSKKWRIFNSLPHHEN